MLTNRLIILPKVDKDKDIVVLINELKITLDTLDKKVPNKEKRDKIAIIIKLLIKKLEDQEINVEEYLHLRKEMINTDNSRLDRIIDAYIYVLENNRNEVEIKTNNFININNIDMLQDRIVLIKYNEKRPTKYKTYIKNINYLDIFNFLRDVDGKYLLLVNKVINTLGIDKITEINETEVINYALSLFEDEFSYFNKNELTKILYLNYQKELLKTLKSYIIERISRINKQEYNAQAEYFKKAGQDTLDSKARYTLKYSQKTRNYLSD